MTMFLRRWLHRLLEWRLRRQRRKELAGLGEAESVMTYLDDQIEQVNSSIFVVHTELMGMVHVRDTLIHRRDQLDHARNQAEAMYRSA